jgi:hypothetical protein
MNLTPAAPTQETPKSPVVEVKPVLKPNTTASPSKEAPASAAPEGGTPPPIEPEKPKESATERFAIAKRREMKLAAERKALADEKASVAAERKRIEDFEARKRNALTDPLAYLAEAGLTYDHLAKYVLGENKPTEGMKAEQTAQELARLRKDLEEKEAKRAEAETARLRAEQQRQIEGFESQLLGHVKANVEKYDLINSGEEYQLVIDCLRLHHKEVRENGAKLLTTDELLDLIEKELESKEDAKFKKSKKLSSKYAAREAAEQVKPEAEKPKQASVTPLNNGHTSSSATKPFLTEKERIARAMALQVPQPGRP